MNVDEFCERYMEGMEPLPFQREWIEAFLAVQAQLLAAGFGGGKSTVQRAFARFIRDHELHGHSADPFWRGMSRR